MLSLQFYHDWSTDSENTEGNTQSAYVELDIQANFVGAITVPKKVLHD